MTNDLAIRILTGDVLGTSEQTHEAIKMAVKALSLPSAKPERTGKWLHDDNFYYETRFVCSECKESECVPSIGFAPQKPLWDYCPNCGAKMDGERGTDVCMDKDVLR